MQDKFCSSLQFLQRTDDLAHHLGCYLRDLPDKIGISERSMFGYRAGKYPVTAKALRKLESAERSAGIHSVKPPSDIGIAMNDALVEYKAQPRAHNNDPFSSVPHGTLETDPAKYAGPDLQEVHRTIAEMQSRIQASLASAQFTMKELRRRMQDAGSPWPPTDEEEKLTPAQLWAKYAP